MSAGWVQWPCLPAQPLNHQLHPRATSQRTPAQPQDQGNHQHGACQGLMAAREKRKAREQHGEPQTDATSLQHHHGNPPTRDVYKASDRLGWLPVQGAKQEFKLMTALTVQHFGGRGEKKKKKKKKKKNDRHTSPACISTQEWLEIICLLIFLGRFCLLLQWCW